MLKPNYQFEKRKRELEKKKKKAEKADKKQVSIEDSPETEGAVQPENDSPQA